jgi:hypothetical protein
VNADCRSFNHVISGAVASIRVTHDMVSYKLFTRVHVRMRKYQYGHTLYGVRIWAHTLYAVCCGRMRNYAPEIRFPLKNRFFITGVAYWAARGTRIYVHTQYTREYKRAWDRRARV